MTRVWAICASVLLCATWAEASCSTTSKKVRWYKAGHNQDCTSVCKKRDRKPVSSGDSKLCATYDIDFELPPIDWTPAMVEANVLPTDWVPGAYRDLQQDPLSPQKECYVHPKYGDQSDPIAMSSNFYCACYRSSEVCKPWRPKWLSYKMPSAKSLPIIPVPWDPPTCLDTCAQSSSGGISWVPVDNPDAISYNFPCRGRYAESAIGYEHYRGDPVNDYACHVAKYDKVNGTSYTTTIKAYDCLCQRGKPLPLVPLPVPTIG